MTGAIADTLILSRLLEFAITACALSFLFAPSLLKLLTRFGITRQAQYDATISMESRKYKANTPLMGGLLMIVSIALLTFFFNWDRRFTWVPIGVMLISALLGGVDDLMNIFGTKRRSRTIAQTWNLIKVHQDKWARFWLFITLPWTAFKRTSLWLGSNPGKGVHVSEKLLLQFAAGAMSAWWIYFKLGENWQNIYIPFTGLIDVGWLLVPLIIFFVMLTANAVNISDGMDGLASGMLLPTFTALALISWIHGFTAMALLNATVAGSLIAYTYYNIKPAKMQMGDVGSLGLGALLAVNALTINQMSVLPLLAFMFYVETGSVLLQVGSRYIFGKRIFKMTPLHHHYELLGISEEKVVMRFWIIHLLAVILAVWISIH